MFELAQRTGCLKRFVIFGSYVTDKVNPNDSTGGKLEGGVS
jgi:hypothetical protein